jgi:hypothetical protein
MALTGHASAHAGSWQCIHLQLKKRHFVLPVVSSCSSLNWMCVYVLKESFGGLVHSLLNVVSSPGRLFHRLHVTWHALQPMHFAGSTNTAYSMPSTFQSHEFIIYNIA